MKRFDCVMLVIAVAIITGSLACLALLIARPDLFGPIGHISKIRLATFQVLLGSVFIYCTHAGIRLLSEVRRITSINHIHG